MLLCTLLRRYPISKSSMADQGTGIMDEPNMNILTGNGIGDIRVDSPDANQKAIASHGVNFWSPRSLVG